MGFGGQEPRNPVVPPSPRLSTIEEKQFESEKRQRGADDRRMNHEVFRPPISDVQFETDQSKSKIFPSEISLKGGDFALINGFQTHHGQVIQRHQEQLSSPFTMGDQRIEFSQMVDNGPTSSNRASTILRKSNDFDEMPNPYDWCTLLGE